MSAEYEIELNLVREATRVFDAVRKAYRAGTIGDDEFLASKAVYTEAEKRFEIAFSKEERRVERVCSCRNGDWDCPHEKPLF